ncbi:hypothetical protein SBOR_4231 [Sclerotinia borealis F-4128]|uniref:Glycosyltransferase 2 n=1 Tax=Sclerotinia borealis (strain F-4128) TaxID=1432307 RepID=W9CLK4_SCLBF|nr:hypothetical protein SBOR_4231 [Sclerotinia borealis F-4128]
MPLPPRLFNGDVELGKRDDDHKPGSKTPLGLAWKHRRPHVQRRSIKKIIFGLLVGIGLYYFYKYMPTDLQNPRQRPHYTQFGGVPAQAGLKGTGGSKAPSPQLNPKQVSKSTDDESTELSGHTYNGPIRFYQLATTLHAMSKVKGSDLLNNNVLFAASSLKSASSLLPIACEMALRERNYVHFAFMGRDDIPMDILKSVNGINKDCQIFFHDARPDFSLHSSDFRMEVSCSAGLNHINTFVHPQAVIIDTSGDEDDFLISAFRTRANALDRTLIELPAKIEQNLMWIVQLDSAALSAWTKISIDIIVHAQPQQSGSLIRLLTSLKKADYFSSNIPRLTIELPHDVDEPTKRFLANFKWPPKRGQDQSSLTLHHRIPQHGLTPEENSIKFMESFWPANPMFAHVLVLSPQAELSPLYFHYLKFALLEYRYSYNRAVAQKNMLGISLDLPTTYLNDSTEFTPPIPPSVSPSPFLWQAPNSNAALYFGDKWVELHDFVARAMFSQHTLLPPATLGKNYVSKTYPSWLEYILKLARARGYWTLYPHFESWDALSTIHTDLYKSPEEYMDEPDEVTDFTANPAEHLSLKHKEEPLIIASLQTLLSDLPVELAEMQMIGWDGENINNEELQLQANEYARVFRHEIGGCAIGVAEKERVHMLAGDLFCSGHEPIESLEPPAPVSAKATPVLESIKASTKMDGVVNTVEKLST